MSIHKIVVPTPFPVGPVNLYLCEGDALTLIDTGPNTDEAYDTIAQGLREHGYAIRDLKRIIITHTHPDHFGLTHQLVKESDATVWTHPFNSEWFNDLPNAIERRSHFTLDLFKQAGVSPPIIEAMRQFSPMLAQLYAAVPVSHWLNVGDVIELDNAGWQVVFTPGHAGGHSSLYQPDTQQMIMGDHLLKHISSNALVEAPTEGEPRVKALAQYIEALQRVAELDVRIAYTGHGEDIHDHRALIAERLKFHESRFDHIENLLRKGEHTLYQLVRAMFPRLRDFDLFLGLSEVLGHLDIMQARGRVVEEPRNGHVVYKVIGNS
jgi:glyoxylase-like metal-dependent hydrolase (beta-lactamase superfamily II)